MENLMLPFSSNLNYMSPKTGSIFVLAPQIHPKSQGGIGGGTVYTPRKRTNVP